MEQKQITIPDWCSMSEANDMHTGCPALCDGLVQNKDYCAGCEFYKNIKA